MTKHGDLYRNWLKRCGRQYPDHATKDSKGRDIPDKVREYMARKPYEANKC